MNGHPSSIEAISPAIEHVKRVLFRPFDLGRWLILGFLAFLQLLGHGGGYNGFGNPGNSFNWKERQGEFQSGAAWLSTHWPIVAFVGFWVILFFLALVVLLEWLSARGTFCYLDCIATNRAEVVRPWREHKEVADSYFFWRLLFSLTVLFLLVLLLIPFLFSLFTLVRSGVDLTPSRLLLGTGLLIFVIPPGLLLLIGAAIVKTLLLDFVAPVQYLRRVRCAEAFRMVLGLVRANPGSFILYFVLRFLISIVVGFGILLLGCGTCCIGFCCLAIPVIGQTILQPIYVFNRAFPLFFLRGFGPGFDVFPAIVVAGGPDGGAPPAQAPSGSGYGSPTTPGSREPGQGPTTPSEPGSAYPGASSSGGSPPAWVEPGNDGPIVPEKPGD